LLFPLQTARRVFVARLQTTCAPIDVAGADSMQDERRFSVAQWPFKPNLAMLGVSHYGEAAREFGRGKEGACWIAG